MTEEKKATSKGKRSKKSSASSGTAKKSSGSAKAKSSGKAKKSSSKASGKAPAKRVTRKKRPQTQTQKLLQEQKTQMLSGGNPSADASSSPITVEQEYREYRNYPRAAQQPAIRKNEEMWDHVMAGGSMFMLALILLLALCHLDGILLSFILKITGGLFGWSMKVFPFFLCAAGVFILRNMQPIRLRVMTLLEFPILMSAFLQCMHASSRFTISFQTIRELWRMGKHLDNGGVIGGMMGTILCVLLSPLGAKILLIMVMLFMLFIIFDTTPAMLLQQIKRLPSHGIQQLQEQDMVVTPAESMRQPASVSHSSQNDEGRKRIDNLQRELNGDTGMLYPEDAFATSMIEPFAYEQAQAEARLASQQRSQRLASVLPNGEPDLPDKHTALEAEPLPPEADILPWEDNEEAPAMPETSTEVLTEDMLPKQPAKEEIQAQVQQEIHQAMEKPAAVYQYPKLHLLKKAEKASGTDVRAELKESAERLVDTLASFGIHIDIVNIVRGPSVTRFEIQTERGIKFSRITTLSDDIALSLGADTVRIAPIPDKLAIGIEVPNRTVQMVALRDVIGSERFKHSTSNLSVALGKDITGMEQVVDLAKMPHLLIAGTTGSGKSVCINSILISLLYKSSPEDVRLIMVDPKMVELGNYNGIPHLLIPVVTDPKKASGALSWAVCEMERRYSLFAASGVRSLADYNRFAREQNRKLEQQMIENTEAPLPARHLDVLPQIVIVIDELADLMMVAAKEVETSICRIAQKARAAGMHLVVATQRPSTDVITGLMKSNIPSRIAFAVASQVESRIILDTTGADKLIGKGDMLYAPLGMGKPIRIQGCFVSSEEIEQVITHVKSTSTVEYSQEVMEHIERQEEAGDSGDSGYNAAEDEDELLPQAIEIVVKSGQASSSMLQRRLKLGYARAARLIDQMEERGIVGASEGSKPRRVLITPDDWKEIQLRKQI